MSPYRDPPSRGPAAPKEERYVPFGEWLLGWAALAFILLAGAGMVGLILYDLYQLARHP